jgi:hypothetical protein
MNRRITGILLLEAFGVHLSQGVQVGEGILGLRGLSFSI